MTEYHRIEFDAYGDPGVLQLRQARLGPLTAGHVRVRVAAAGVQPFDAKLRRGQFSARLAPHPGMTLGNEFAGTVVETAPEETEYAMGDEVLGFTTPGAYAELLDVPATNITRRPSNLDVATAAGLSGAGQTAANALRTLDVGPGDVLLVHAAAGGVGTVACQLGLLRGARVIGTASPHNHDHLRALGVEPVDYHHGLREGIRALAPDGIDAALDLVGGVAALNLDLVRDPERIGTTVDDEGAALHGFHRLRGERSATLLAELADLASARQLSLPVSQTYPLADAALAHIAIETGHTRGKIVLGA